VSGATMRRREGKLPASVTRLVGRRREVAEINRLLSVSRLVTLTGVGGVGKTRLALHVAFQRRRAFADGAWWVELADVRSADLLVVTAMRAVGLADPVTGDAAELIEYVRERQLLLVLDNCEHLVGACAVLVDELLRAAPGLHVLATSREPLSVAGEHAFLVPPLSVPPEGATTVAGGPVQHEAVTLFAERAAAAAPGFALTAGNRQAVAALCQKLDGLPLAIELAAGRARALSPEQILHRLDDQYSVITSAGRARPSRHQTLQAAMDWSFQLCSEREQLLWIRLVVFAGGFDLDAVEAVCVDGALTREEVLEALIGLVDKSIVMREERGGRGRHWMLETVRQYGLHRPDAAGGVQRLRRRHRDYYLELAGQFDREWFGPDQAEWIERMRAEHANIRATLGFCFGDTREAKSGLALASALWFYWVSYGPLWEGRYWLDRGLSLNSQQDPERARALWVNADLAVLQGDVPAALPMLSECRRLASDIHDQVALSCATFVLCLIDLFGDTPQRAVALLEKTLARERALTEPDPLGSFPLFVLALGNVSLGNIDRGAELAEDCLARCQARGEQWVRSYAFMALGMSEFLRGRIESATARMREAVTIKREFNDVRGIAWAIEGFAWIAAEENDAVRSARLFGASRVLWQPVGAYLSGSQIHLGWHDQYENKVRNTLGETAFLAAFQQGTQLSTDEAIAYARGTHTPLPPARVLPPAVLTKREAQVAALVATGASNKDIADQLVISQRTAEGHVEHILAKLGFTSRAQIATWITAQQPPTGPLGTVLLRGATSHKHRQTGQDNLRWERDWLLIALCRFWAVVSGSPVPGQPANKRQISKPARRVMCRRRRPGSTIPNRPCRAAAVLLRSNDLYPIKCYPSSAAIAKLTVSTTDGISSG
jgi:predicted ATPase/DNA-binding CsgD family transcriptional regulator